VGEGSSKRSRRAGDTVVSDQYDIYAVLAHYGWDLPGERSGWVSVRCGAHEDGHASCRISGDTGYVLCMACSFPKDGKAGDAIDVVRHYEGTGFRDSKRRAEEITAAGGRVVSRSTGASRSVSDGSRGNGRNRKYVPPRLRERA